MTNKTSIQGSSKLGSTNLSERMRGLAKVREDLPEGWHKAADDFDAAAIGYYSELQTVSVKQFLGCFARARRLWCEVTGEPLVDLKAGEAVAGLQRVRPNDVARGMLSRRSE